MKSKNQTRWPLRFPSALDPCHWPLQGAFRFSTLRRNWPSLYFWHLSLLCMTQLAWSEIDLFSKALFSHMFLAEKCILHSACKHTSTYIQPNTSFINQCLPCFLVLLFCSTLFCWKNANQWPTKWILWPRNGFWPVVQKPLLHSNLEKLASFTWQPLTSAVAGLLVLSLTAYGPLPWDISLLLIFWLVSILVNCPCILTEEYNFTIKFN